MIKFNEVTWYSKLAAAIFFIGIFPVLTFYIGTEYQKTQQIVTFVTSQTSNPVADSSYKLLTYKNEMYGWTFKYPSTWKITEGIEKTSVSIESATKIPDPSNPKKTVPAAKIYFGTVKKTDFGTVNSKVGIINFDLQKNALVDNSYVPSRCLPISDHIGLGNSLSAFMYTGSLMSDPAYSSSAIVTNKDYLVTFGWDMYETSDAVIEGKSIIYATLELAPDVFSNIPGCVAR